MLRELVWVFFFKQKTAYELRISDWSSDVCSSDLVDSNGENPLLPYGATYLEDALNYAGLDYDASATGLQPYAEHNVAFKRLTGRAVLDYKITPDNLIYMSYSRGYKSGGINPPLSPVFAVPVAFEPEKEIGRAHV